MVFTIRPIMTLLLHDMGKMEVSVKILHNIDRVRSSEEIVVLKRAAQKTA